MTDPTFTILMPVVRQPDLMPFALHSILSQTRSDFEVFIVGDGAPPETIAVANLIAREDNRVQVFPFGKGERHGEAHRHTVLQQARGRYVCGLADDDLWFPEHLAEMAILLEGFEFGHLLHANVLADDRLFLGLADLAEPQLRAKMAAEVYSFFGPSNAGYRIETYHRLPVGWSAAPEGVPSDLAMWRKFLALPDIVAGTRFVLTSLHFATAHRADWSIERRREEIVRYAGIVATSQGRDRLRQMVLAETAREHVARHEYILCLLRRAEWLEAQLALARDRPDGGCARQAE